MHKLFLAVSLLALLLPVRANDILLNGDFSDGTTHWEGDGASIDSSGDVNLSNMSDPGMAQGLVIKLKPTEWTKVFQTFETKENALDFRIIYRTSADCNIPYDTSPGVRHVLTMADLATMLGCRFKKPIPLKAHAWLIMILDRAESLMTYYEIQSPVGSPKAQVVHGTIPKLAAHEDKTIYLAFPPGQEAVILEKVVLMPTLNPAAPTP